MTFQKKVYGVVRRIPRGSVLTYAQVARRIGKAKAYRAVARALAQNFDRSIPCHRVIRTDGRLGGYNGLQGRKLELLKTEKAI